MVKMRRIYEALLNRKEKVCTRQEIIEIIEEYNRNIGKISLKNALKYLSRHKYVKRIFLHFYYINNMDEREQGCNYSDKELLFTALNKANIKWYIGLNSSLYLLGKTWQTPNILLIVNEKISGKKKILSLNIKFMKTRKYLIFGLKKGRTKNNVDYNYSDLTKTYIDLAYFRISKKLITTKDTRKYIRRYPAWLRRSI